MGVLYVVTLLDVDGFRRPAGVLLVTADSCRWFRVWYHELNVYRKFGRGQKLSYCSMIDVYPCILPEIDKLSKMRDFYHSML